jgi:hypothetical protein
MATVVDLHLDALCVGVERAVENLSAYLVEVARNQDDCLPKGVVLLRRLVLSIRRMSRRAPVRLWSVSRGMEVAIRKIFSNISGSLG